MSSNQLATLTRNPPNPPVFVTALLSLARLVPSRSQLDVGAAAIACLTASQPPIEPVSVRQVQAAGSPRRTRSAADNLGHLERQHAVRGVCCC